MFEEVEGALDVAGQVAGRLVQGRALGQADEERFLQRPPRPADLRGHEPRGAAPVSVRGGVRGAVRLGQRRGERPPLPVL